ncbi:hypothetical protein [Corallococcus sp. M7]
MSDVEDRNRRKLERLRRELRALRTEFAAWLEQRRAKDVCGQHASQYAALEDCVTGAAQGLEKHLGGLRLDQPRGEFAEECRRHGQRILWLRRLWKYFRDRLDQRDDPRLAPLLLAADEVVWSAWRPVFERAPALGLSVTGGPTPLPFIDLEYSAAATPRALVGRELRRDGGPLLADYLEQLPMALLHLPISCVASPWWLVFIGHEVGHQLQFQLGLVAGFRALLEQAVHAASNAFTLEDASVAAQRWGRWSEEVFADVYSVLSFGTAAVRAMAEFEQHSDARMRAERERYPPAAVRLHLLVRVAEALGLSGARAALDGWEPHRLVAEGAPSEEDYRLVDAVVEASLADLPGHDVSLKDLLGFDVGTFALEWPTVPSPFDLTGPRRMISAALAAWDRVDAEEDAEALEALAVAVPQLLGEKRLPGRRSAPRISDSTRVDGDRLSELLLDLDAEHLEAATGAA